MVLACAPAGHGSYGEVFIPIIEKREWGRCVRVNEGE
jgi:hypothetical protein